ncbi:3-oxoacyl-[acyl-carrier protein] reductase [Pseudonocardia sp. Ae168_Ps1]|nr:3-oxoacyl-[acyl-carrier protein] reductase [Pseudonocardia sp. Ae168_Ps1]OLL96116.1 3-oxoacyl-[acyl-carrier protein] reductase [Pseudonocardia sp. Ae356_Ps1]
MDGIRLTCQDDRNRGEDVRVPSPDAAARRVALLTGGARGIGAAVARRLAADGHAVAVDYATSGAEAEALVEEIRGAGGTAECLQADVTDPAAVTELVERVTALWAAPSVLVNNAGMNLTASARRLDPADWDRVIGVNLSGAFYCTHAVLPAMYEAGHGRIVFVGSPAAGRSVLPGTGAYAAAKAGVGALVEVLAKETARRGITVNSVIPGFVETGMTRGEGEKAMEVLRGQWPEIPPDAVADAVSYLVADRAAHVSGEQLGVWLGGPSGLHR